ERFVVGAFGDVDTGLSARHGGVGGRQDGLLRRGFRAGVGIVTAGGDEDAVRVAGFEVAAADAVVDQTVVGNLGQKRAAIDVGVVAVGAAVARPRVAVRELAVAVLVDAGRALREHVGIGVVAVGGEAGGCAVGRRQQQAGAHLTRRP